MERPIEPEHSQPAPESDPLMSIGMFSRASLVSVKSLRAYHEQGILVPDSVDPATGYRSYRVSQLPDAVIIKRLRDLDMPLRDVAEVVSSRDPDVTRKVISEHQTAMRARLEEVAGIVEALQQAMELPSLHTPVHVRNEPPTHALSYSGPLVGADYATFLGGAYARVWSAIEKLGAEPAGPGSARYPAEVETDDEVVEAYVPIVAPVVVTEAVGDTGVVMATIPAETCAIATHVGSYATIGDTYRQLGSWIARHAVAADSPVREHYVVSIDPDTLVLLPDDQLRTEIAWPIRSVTESHTPSERTMP